MELRVLRYFLMAAREENITKAAQLLHVTQPTLSRQLMQLEEELGVRLFHRSRHNIVLTDEGMLLKRRAQELVSLADKTKRELSREEGAVTGEIAIGSGELHSVQFLAEMLASFRKRYPLIHYEFYSGNSDNIKERIERGILDIGILLEPVEMQKYDFLRLPAREVWGVLVHQESALAAKESVEPQDLLGTPLMMTKRELARSELANWFGDLYDRLEIIASYNLLYNIAMLVQKNMGAALCLKLDSLYEDLCFVPLAPPLTTNAVFAWKKNQAVSPATSLFIEHIKKCIKGICDHVT